MTSSRSGTTARPERPSGRFQLWAASAAGAVCLTGLALGLTDYTTQLTPDHNGARLALGLGVAAAIGVLTLILILWRRWPVREPRLLTAPFTALSVAFVAGFLSAVSAGRLWEFLDFREGGQRYEAQFVIDRAYVSHGKGVHHHIQLRQPFADLTVSKDEYQSLFGSSDDLHPQDLCLRAPVEQSGEALRIMYASSRAIPPGRIGRCFRWRSMSAGVAGR